MKKFALIISLFLAIATFGVVIDIQSANAWTLNLGWDANIEADLAGYKLYYATAQGAYDFENPSELLGAGATQTGVVIADGFHCWVLTAYDIANNESDPSNEVCLTLPDDYHLYDHTPPSMPGGFAPIDILP